MTIKNCILGIIQNIIILGNSTDESGNKSTTPRRFLYRSNKQRAISSGEDNIDINEKVDTINQEETSVNNEQGEGKLDKPRKFKLLSLHCAY